MLAFSQSIFLRSERQQGFILKQKAPAFLPASPNNPWPRPLKTAFQQTIFNSLLFGDLALEAFSRWAAQRAGEIHGTAAKSEC
jgi:hypothetical protein